VLGAKDDSCGVGVKTRDGKSAGSGVDTIGVCVGFNVCADVGLIGIGLYVGADIGHGEGSVDLKLGNEVSILEGNFVGIAVGFGEVGNPIVSSFVGAYVGSTEGKKVGSCEGK